MNTYSRFSGRGLASFPRLLSAARTVISVCSLAAVCLPASAQNPSKVDIVIGQTADLSGVQMANVKEMSDAAFAYFDKINKAGGIDGRQIKVISIDDKYDPKLSAANAKQLDEKNVLALILGRGTANAEAVIPVAMGAKLPVLGFVGGSVVMHSPAKRYFFNLRPPYRLEVERAIGQLLAQGTTKLATVYTDDAFGLDALEGFKTGMTAAKLEAVATLSLPRGDPKVDDAVAKLMAAKPDAIIGLCVPKPCAHLVRELRAAGFAGRFLSLSNTASSSYVKELGEFSRGVIVTQVFPSPYSVVTAVSNEFQKLAAEYKLPQSYAGMEGYINARVLVDAIKRTGGKTTRESLVTALDSMRSVDYGGYLLTFSPTDHTGSEVVELSIIGKDGRFMR